MSEELRLGFLPYCLDQQPDGRYAVLNRRYKPVGMTTASSDFVRYQDHPCLVRLPGLTVKVARQLSCDASEDLQRVYLYRDGTCPTTSDANWAAYAQRLQILAALKADA